MRTVRWLREELLRFPDDAVVYAYEGEVTGLIIEHLTEQRYRKQGIIHCSEDDSQQETQLLLP